MLNWHNIEVFL